MRVAGARTLDELVHERDHLLIREAATRGLAPRNLTAKITATCPLHDDSELIALYKGVLVSDDRLMLELLKYLDLIACCRQFLGRQTLEAHLLHDELLATAHGRTHEVHVAEAARPDLAHLHIVCTHLESATAARFSRAPHNWELDNKRTSPAYAT